MLIFVHFHVKIINIQTIYIFFSSKAHFSSEMKNERKFLNEQIIEIKKFIHKLIINADINLFFLD